MTFVLDHIGLTVGEEVVIDDVSLTLRAGNDERSAGPDARRQDDADAADGGLGQADDGAPAARRRRRHQRSRAAALGRDGLSAIRQLPLAYRLREHRLAAARRRRRRRRDRRARQGSRALAAAGKSAAAPARRNCRAASSSAPRSRARWSSAPTSCCSTSRWPISTTNCARNCARNCRASSPQPARSWFMRRPSRPKRCCSAASTITLSEGRVTQFGPTALVYRSPDNIDAARVFSDPPLNELAIEQDAARSSRLRAGAICPPSAPCRVCPTAPIAWAFAPTPSRSARARPSSLSFPGEVAVTEISGSESFVHVDVGFGVWVVSDRGRSRLAARRQGRRARRRRPRLRLRRRRQAGGDARPSRKRLEGDAMARITLDRIAHAYGGKPRSEADYQLKPLHHVWEQGMAYALLGPSGCGKTTLLNIISGLVIPSEGRLLFDDDGRDASADRTAQHRAGVPVSRDLRHDDGRGKPRVSAEEPATCPRPSSTGASPRSPRCSI